MVLSNDILSYALSDVVKVGVTFGSFSGTSYTGVLPAESLKFGTWEINKRNSGSVSIKCQDIDNNTIWTNTHANNAWKGWVSYVKSSDLNKYVQTRINAEIQLGYIAVNPSEKKVYFYDKSGVAKASIAIDITYP